MTIITRRFSDEDVGDYDIKGANEIREPRPGLGSDASRFLGYNQGKVLIFCILQREIFFSVLATKMMFTTRYPTSGVTQPCTVRSSAMAKNSQHQQLTFRLPAAKLGWDSPRYGVAFPLHRVTKNLTLKSQAISYINSGERSILDSC